MFMISKIVDKILIRTSYNFRFIKAANGFPMHVALDDRTRTTAEILCEQIKCLDISVRDAVYEEFVSDEIMDEVIDLICSFIEQ